MEKHRDEDGMCVYGSGRCLAEDATDRALVDVVTVESLNVAGTLASTQRIGVSR